MRALLFLPPAVFFLNLLLSGCLSPDSSSASYKWTAQNSGTSMNLRSVHFLDSLTGYAAGDQGTILKTTNGGDTWTAKVSGTSLGLSEIVFLNPATGFAAGDSCVVLKTTNGGESWSRHGPPLCPNLMQSVAFPSPDTGFAIGEKGLLIATYDAGDTWAGIAGGQSGLDGAGLAFASPQVGLYGRMETPNSAARPFRTTDGGVTWQEQDVIGQRIHQFQFVDGSLGYALTFSGGKTVMRTTNGGLTWSTLVRATGSPGINAIHFMGTDTGYAVGLQGAILRMAGEDGGWVREDGGGEIALQDVYFANARNGWTVGQGGAILKRTAR